MPLWIQLQLIVQCNVTIRPIKYLYRVGQNKMAELSFKFVS